MKYVLIGIGGACGAMTRVLLGQLLPTAFMTLPILILMINTIGCFIAGISAALLAANILPEDFQTFLIPGFLGGFTTFSAFTLDIGHLYEKQLYNELCLYIGASLVFSITAFFIGLKITKYWLS